MNNSGKTIFLIIAIVYFLSPFDLASGVIIDDLVVLFFALAPFFKKSVEA